MTAAQLIATQMIADHTIRTRATCIFCLSVLVLAGCGSLQPPPRPLVYDFGPGTVLAAPVGGNPTASGASWAVAFSGVQTASALDSTQVLYRLAYSDAQQLRPYAHARWSMAPADLVRQRLREQLGARRVVLNPTDGLAAPVGSLTLRVDLDEFSQLFETADKSAGLVRLRATVGQTTAAGKERLVAQRSFAARHSSMTMDAAGGVRALTDATEAVVQELDQWLADTQKSLVNPAPAGQQ
jgi:cholesterol transport system auxiliary component